MKNKYQEALDILISKTGILNDTCWHLSKCLKCGKCFLEDEHFKLPVMECKDYVIAKTLQELVDKETPMKVEYVLQIDDEVWVCPKCNNVWTSIKSIKYCDNCGQKLDWSDE